MFIICEMEEEVGKSVDVVPLSWFDDATKTCAWPPVKNPHKLIERGQSPDVMWKRYPARIIGSRYESYEKARPHLADAEYTSDLNTETEEGEGGTPRKRQAKVPKRLQFGEDSDDETESPAKKVRKQTKKLLPKPPVLVSGPCLAAVEGTSQTGSVTCSERAPLPASAGTVQQTVPSLVTFTTVSPTKIGIGASEIIIQHQLTPVTTSQPLSKLNSSSAAQGSNRREETNSSDLLRKILGEVNVLKQYVLNLEGKVDLLRKEMSTSQFQGQPTSQLAKKLPLPFGSVEALEGFDAKLTEEEKNGLEVLIKTSGGDTTVELVGRALKKIFQDELAVKFSLRGLKDNKSFSATKLYGVLKDVILSIRKLNADEKMIEKAVSEWFRHANERLKKKKKSIVSP